MKLFSALEIHFCHKKQETWERILKLCVWENPQGIYPLQSGNEKGAGLLRFTGIGLLMIIMLSASSAYALDLAEMQNMALNNRKIIQRYISTLEQSEKDIILAREGYYPSVDISYIANSLDEPSLTEYKENSVATGRVSLLPCQMRLSSIV